MAAIKVRPTFLTKETAIKLKFPSPKYFLYILQLHNTGHFYIGVTCNCKRREEMHFSAIYNLVYGIRTHEFIHNRKKIKPEFDPKIGQSVHLFFAKKIKPLVAEYIAPKRTIQWHYSFSIKHACYTQEEIRYLEDTFLKMYKDNKKCLNLQFYSAYKHQVTLKK